MKTTANTTTTTVKVSQLALYLAIVAIMAFFNCLFIKAGEPEKDNSTTNITEQIKVVSAELADETLEIEDWMLDFSETYFAEIVEEELRLEAWMFDIESEQQEFYGITEAEIRLEPWMTVEEESFVAFVEEEEEEVRLEAWMLNYDAIEGPIYYADVVEEDLEIENWMLSICCWELTELLAENK